MADELPPEIAALWGLREPPRRGRRPTLTAADITAAAIKIADAEGLAAVSMARVAAELGNATMALYRHVRSKDELLLLMVDQAIGPPPRLPAGAGWREGLACWARATIDARRRHPWSMQVGVTSPPAGPNHLGWLDRALGTLAGTPLAEGEKLAIVMGVTTLVYGEMRLRMELASGYQDNPEAFSRQYATVLKRVVDPRELPALGGAVEAGVFDHDDLLDEDDMERDFDFILGLYLDGVAAHIERRG
jgi:AcrR family transcriptional regulator